MSATNKEEMQGFCLYDAGENDEQIPLWQLVYGLQATVNLLNNSDNTCDTKDDLEGMTCAVRVLETLLCRRYTSQDVIEKPLRKSRQPRPPDNRPRKRKSGAAVASLVQSEPRAQVA